MEEEAYKLYAEIEEAIVVRDGLQQDTFRPLLIDDDTEEVGNTQNGLRHSSRGSNSGSSTTLESSAQPTVVPIHLKNSIECRTPTKKEPQKRQKGKGTCQQISSK